MWTFGLSRSGRLKQTCETLYVTINGFVGYEDYRSGETPESLKTFIHVESSHNSVTTMHTVLWNIWRYESSFTIYCGTFVSLQQAKARMQHLTSASLEDLRCSEFNDDIDSDDQREDRFVIIKSGLNQAMLAPDNTSTYDELLPEKEERRRILSEFHLKKKDERQRREEKHKLRLKAIDIQINSSHVVVDEINEEISPVAFVYKSIINKDTNHHAVL